MASSSNASKKQNPIRSRLRKSTSLLSNDANRAASAAANPAKPQIAIPKTSASPAPDQLSPIPRVVVLPTTHPPSTSLIPADAASRHILNKVLEQLKEEDKRVIGTVTSSDDISSVLSAVYTACEEKGKLCRKEGWEFRFGESTVRLRDEADKVIFWLDNLKRVGDIAANADPIHVGLPWVAIRVLLEVCKFVVYFAIVRKCKTIF